MKPVKGIQHTYIRNARLAECFVAGVMIGLVALVGTVAVMAFKGIPDIINALSAIGG
jgi:hypothetical protein